MQAQKTVKTIAPTVGRLAESSFAPAAKKRVAAYARVSTDSDEQLNSYEAQVDYYTNYIQANPDWIFVEVYADEGTTGVMTKGRDDFNRMVRDALNGKIDFIVTKSVARFARNTVDSLVTVRKLKEKGVEIYFEKENIYTLDSKGELMLTIMSSLAQEESRSISENVTWGQRKRMQDGKVSMPYKRFLGYAKGEDGVPQVVEAEAAVVRQIYARFLGGATYREIAARLTEQGIPTPGGKAVWSVSTVRSILKNEKYAGNALLQKAYTVDFLTKKRKANEGEVPQYFVENSHPAIVTPATFELTQDEIRRREAIGKQLSGSGLFVCKIVCGDCGGFYGSKVWDSNNKYRRTVWQCNHKYQNEDTCRTTHLTEDEIKSAFVAAFNRLVADRARYIAKYEEQIKELADTAGFDEQTARLEIECADTAMLARDYVGMNTTAAQDQARYQQEYDALVARYDAAKSQLEIVKREKLERVARREKVRQFLATLRSIANPLTAFDDRLWQKTVEAVRVSPSADITVVFRGGAEIRLEADAYSQ
jgi:DNA invertase Pin-like site-specific DNA recombinase